MLGSIQKGRSYQRGGYLEKKYANVNFCGRGGMWSKIFRSLFKHFKFVDYRGREEGSSLNILKTWFQYNNWPIKPTQWADFLVGFGGRTHFPPKNKDASWISHDQSRDNNSILMSHKKFSQICPKMTELWPKTYAQIWACATHNFAKYQYFSMKCSRTF